SRIRPLSVASAAALPVDLRPQAGHLFRHDWHRVLPIRKHRSGGMAATTTIRSALIAAGLAAVPAVTALAQINDSIRGAPSEANHFIGTPEGWKHPMTPWGDPDIQATLDMMQASRVPLERCADSYRPGAEPCDPNQKWLPEEEYNARMEAYQNQVDRFAELMARGDLAAAMRAAGPNRIPQRQTNLLVDPANGMLPPLTQEAK